MATTNDPNVSLRPWTSGTIDLIRWRCERGVRSDLLRWSGLPIGGTGAVAFLFALLVWIPQQIQNAELDQVSHDAIRSYVEATLVRHPEFRSRLTEVVPAALKESTGQEVESQIETLISARVEDTYTTAIDDAISEELVQVIQAPALRIQINSSVAQTLGGNNFQQLRVAIAASIKRRMAETVAENAKQAIEEVANPLPEERIIDKSTWARLQQQVRELSSSPLPPGDFALRKYIAAGGAEDHTYDPNLIYDYVKSLGQVLGERFRYVLILDRQQRFVALSTVDEFARLMEQEGYRLAEILNNRTLSFEQARQKLAELLGPKSLLAVDDRRTINSALKSSALQDRDLQVAVIEDSEGARLFKGVTHRGRLIEALLPE